MVEFDRQLPSEEGAERIVLGAILLDTEAFAVVSAILSQDSFYSEANVLIFQACKNLFESNKPIDLLTAKKEIDRMGKTEQIGGVGYLMSLTKHVSSSANIEHHAMIIQQKSIQRKLITAGGEIVRMGFDESIDLQDSLDSSEKLINEASSMASFGSNLRTLDACLSESITRAQEREKRAKNGLLAGVPSGLPQLDHMTTGFQGGEMIILAARPSMGKTAIMMHMAISSAKKGYNALVFELEMNASQLSDRMLIGESGIDSDNFRNGYLTSDDWGRIDSSANIISKFPITVDDKPYVSIGYIGKVARKMKKKGKCDIIYIDYIGLMDMVDKGKNRTQEQEVSITSAAIKTLAKKLNVPIIVLSQLNRENEKRSDKEPMLSDLRMSGSLEQDADLVLFIHRPEHYGLREDENGESLKNVGFLIVAKNRNGPIGRVKFTKDDSYTQIYSYEQPKAPPSVAYYNEPLEPNLAFDVPF